MKYALVEGTRQEAQPKLRGRCHNCEREVIAKCGQQRIHHWSHLGKLECDYWWEPETEWHRSWKAKFPEEWQEVVHFADSGERHIADVKTSSGLVVELQHSPIAPEERTSRESFYKSMVWVIDGLRYKRDLPSFREALEYGSIVNDNPMYISPLRSSAGIFKRWAPLQCVVFVDFGDEEFSVGSLPIPNDVLWMFQLNRATGQVVVGAVLRENFMQFCLTGAKLQQLVVTRAQQPRTRYRLPPGRRYQRRL